MSAPKKDQRRTRKSAGARPLTIYDGEKYFDATFSDEETFELNRYILEMCGIEGDSMWLFIKRQEVDRELCRKLGMSSIPYDWATIHICRELEIDYKSFAKNEPKLSIEPFYQFIESRFPEFKEARNKMQLDVQTRQIWTAFIDWTDAECETARCPRSYHGFCRDRYEQPDLELAAQRIWKHNASRPKLTLVHSA